MADNEMVVKASVAPVPVLEYDDLETIRRSDGTHQTYSDLTTKGAGVSVGAESLFHLIDGYSTYLGFGAQTSFFPLGGIYHTKSFWHGIELTSTEEILRGLAWNFSGGLRFKCSNELPLGHISLFAGADLGGTSVMLDSQSISKSELGLSVLTNFGIGYGVNWIEGFVGANMLVTLVDAGHLRMFYPDAGVRISF